MPFDFPDDESLMSGAPICTPSQSAADELWSDMTSRADDERQDDRQDDRPETSCALLFDLFSLHIITMPVI